MAPRTPLRRPTAYFRRPSRPSLGVAALFVAADAVLATAAVWLFMDRVIARSAPSPAAAAEVRGALGGAVLALLIAVPFGWAIISGILHFFVWMADGNRGYGHTLAVVGESHVVSLVLFPVTALGFYLLLGRVPADPEAAAAFFRRAANGGSPLLVLTSLVGGVWRAAIQAIGIGETHGVSVGKIAVVTVGLALLGAIANLL